MIYSGFFRRAVAFILDMVIVAVPAALLFMPVLGVQLAGVETPDQLSQLQMGLFGLTFISWQFFTFLLMWLYFAILESGKHQSTWGKRLLGIKVIGKDGGRISFARATGRFFAKILSNIFYIGFIMAGFTNRKRALHDMLAETYVVKKSFIQGQELPETKSRKFLLVIICLLWVLFVLGLSMLSGTLPMTPTQQAARTAAQRLVNLANQNSRLDEPLRLEGSTFYQTDDGYRAVVVDPDTENKFTLLVQNSSSRVCCQAFPLGDCAATGFAPCEE